MLDDLPAELKTLIPGVLGSAIAAAVSKFSNPDQPWGLLITKAVGGAAGAYYATNPVAKYFGWVDAQGLIGLLLGLFAMAAIMKAWETFDAIKGSVLFGTLVDWIRKLAGLPPKNGDANG